MIQIKKAIKAGNSSAVVLPKSWLNKEVRIELIKKSLNDILHDSINIASEHIEIKNIIGIYLTGSHARNEEDENSDIDVLIITKNIDKEMIKEGIYNILIVSTELLNQKLEHDLLPIGQMLIEAKPLLNEPYLNEIKTKVKVTHNNIKWYLDTTKDKLNIINEAIIKTKKSNKKYIRDRIVYTLIIRIRTLYIIKKLIKNERYLKEDFVNLIKEVTKETTAYQIYISVKNNSQEKSEVTIEETEKLYQYLKKQLVEIKRLL